MTIDAGLKPEGPRSAPHSWRRRPLGRRCRTRSAIRSNARWRWWRVLVANRWMSSPGKQFLCGQADQWADLSARRRGVSPEGTRARRMREDEIAGSVAMMLAAGER